MHSIVTQQALDDALTRVPQVIDDDQPRFGWTMDEDLVTRRQNFGALRGGVHAMAAHALADLAEAMMDSPVRGGDKPRILVLAGPGGNGADGLRAAKLLVDRGRIVHVMVLATPEGGGYREDSANHALLAEFLEAGGYETSGAYIIQEDISQTHCLIIEALVGSGVTGPLRDQWARYAEISRWFPSIAVDVPAGVDPDSGERVALPSAAWEEDEQPGAPTVTLALGALRGAHTGEHCGMVLLASCGLDLGNEWPDTFSRLIRPQPGFRIPESVDDLYPGNLAPLPQAWEQVLPGTATLVLGDHESLGFGILAASTLRNTGTRHRVSLVAPPDTAIPLISRHPDLQVEPTLAQALARQRGTVVVETRDTDTIAEVLRSGGRVILGPSATSTLATADHRLLLAERAVDETIMITRNPTHQTFGDAATVMVLGEHLIHTIHASQVFDGDISRSHLDPVLDLSAVQGIEAVIAGLSAVTYSYALVFLAERIREFPSQPPATAAEIAQGREPRRR